MTHTESIAALAAALATAQGQLVGAKKDSTNPHFKSKYADLASIVEALKGCFPANGLSYSQFICTNESGTGVETMLMHSSGEWLRGDPFFVPVERANAQGFGSALTYCRRYSLAAIAGVAPDDDDGNAATAAAPEKILPRAIPANAEGIDLYNALPTDAKTVVNDIAAECIALARAGNLADAIKTLRGACESHEDELIYASRLPSDVRSKMKAAKQKPQLAEQA